MVKHDLKSKPTDDTYENIHPMNMISPAVLTHVEMMLPLMELLAFAEEEMGSGDLDEALVGLLEEVELKEVELEVVELEVVELEVVELGEV